MEGKNKKVVKKKESPKLFKSRKGQGSINPKCDCRKKIVKGLGLFLFLMGAVLLLSCFFGITGYSISEAKRGVCSILGLVLEIIGISLMAIRIKTKNHIS